MPTPAHRAIENLIARYAELVDDGDFPALGLLLADATFTGSSGSVRGREAIERMFRDTLITYTDGTPRTQHVVSNIAVEVDDQAGTAVSRSYVTVLQALPDFPLQPIAAGRYHDRFERRRAVAFHRAPRPDHPGRRRQPPPAPPVMSRAHIAA